MIQEPLFIVTLFILHKMLGPIKLLSDKLKGNKQFAKALRMHGIFFRIYLQLKILIMEQHKS